MQKRIFTTILLFLTLLSVGCSKKKEEYISRTDYKLNTIVYVALYDKQEEGLLDVCMNLCSRYEQTFSRTSPASELYKLNESRDLEVSDELLELISLGVELGERTDGLFDITIAPVAELWDFSGEEPSVPTQTELDEALSSVDYRNIQIDGNHVTLENDASIDLGALAKGYIADRLKEYLLSEGVTSAIINLGGNTLCIGNKPTDEAFQIAIKKPFADQNEMLEIASVTDQSLVTSGIYERGFEKDGIWYHHILNPATGYPNDTDLTSVSIQSDLSVDGDALSTICMSLGSKKAQEFLQNYPGVKAWFVLKDESVIYVDNN